MGVIKTALEIALERTESVNGDKSSINQFEAKQKGKKLANSFLSGEVDIDSELKKADKKDLDCIKTGIFGILAAQIALPSVKEDMDRFKKLGKGFEAIIKDPSFPAMFNQLVQLFSQYLQEASHCEQMIRQQYAPKLRQKEEELSRRLGREIHIDPFQDPEFTGFYNQHMNALKTNYEPVIEQAREETRKMFFKED